MLTQKIQEDMKGAMRARDDVRVQTLRGAIAAFTYELVAKGMKPSGEVTDEMAMSVLKRLGKQRKDSIEQFTMGARQDLADKERAELKILESYLPASASKDAIERVAREKMTELGVTDASGIGKLTGVVMKELGKLGQSADGNDVREVLQKLLS